MYEKFEQYRDLANRRLEEGGEDALLAAVRGVGYAVLALAETQQLGETIPLEPLMMPMMAGPPVMEKIEGNLGHFDESAFIHPTVEMDDEELARRILQSQLEDGVASVAWEDRGSSRDERIAVACCILDGIRERMVRHTIAAAVAQTMERRRAQHHTDERQGLRVQEASDLLGDAYRILEVAERILTPEPVEVPEVPEEDSPVVVVDYEEPVVGKDWRDEEGMRQDPDVPLPTAIDAAAPDA